MTDGANRIGLLWAGVALGGSILAGPAKFQVEDLTMPVALQVGRVQFLWVCYAEVFCLMAAIVWWLFALSRPTLNHKSGAAGLVLTAIVIFAVQHLLLMPPLQERSERIIAGEVVDESHLHQVYIVLESLKFIALLVAGFLPCKRPAAAE